MRTLAEFAEEAHEELGTSKEELLTLLKDSDVLADLGFDSTTIMACLSRIPIRSIGIPRPLIC